MRGRRVESRSSASNQSAASRQEYNLHAPVEYNTERELFRHVPAHGGQYSHSFCPVLSGPGSQVDNLGAG